MNERKKYIFWVGQIKYSGYIISETDSQWIIIDDKFGEVILPKNSTVCIKGGSQ